MSFLIPDFVPVPSTEAMQAISIVSLIVGICLVSVGLFLLFFNKQKGRERNAATLWFFMGSGVLLIINHSMQLLF